MVEKVRVPGRQAFARAFSSLRNRNYRLFWFGQLVSLAGSWMQDVALSWLVLELTNSPKALGLTMTIRFLPALFLSVYGGILGDRLPKRTTLVVLLGIQLVIAVCFGLLGSLGTLTVTLIYILTAIRGVAESIEGPVRQSFVPEMVGPQDLPNAVALNSTLFNAARIVGPAIGAGVIAAFGVEVCFYLNAASFLAVIGALLAMDRRKLFPVAKPPRQGIHAQMREGFRYVRATSDIVVIFIVVGVIGAFGYNFQTILPLVTKYVLRAGASTLALLTTTMGAGSVVAGLAAAYWGRPSMRRLVGAACGFFGLLVVVAMSRWIGLTLVVLFALGVVGVLFMTSANTKLQLTVPDNMRGRVMGMYMLLFIGTGPIGSYVIGFLAEHLGVRPTVLIMAGLCALGVAGSVLYMRARRADAASATDDVSVVQQ
ncbi:MAG: MFS transporter [Thermoleophilia bacterium]|nr:MFS transporter [Thermoleophilia bacterium]